MSQFSDKERKELKKMVEKFYENVLDPYKEFERAMMRESKVSTIFKKVDYKARLKELEKMQKINKSIKPQSLDMADTDVEGNELKTTLHVAQEALDKIIDAQFEFNDLLYKKSKGEKVTFLTSKKAHKKIKDAIEESRMALKALDVDFSILYF